MAEVSEQGTWAETYSGRDNLVICYELQLHTHRRVQVCNQTKATVNEWSLKRLNHVTACRHSCSSTTPHECIHTQARGECRLQLIHLTAALTPPHADCDIPVAVGTQGCPPCTARCSFTRMSSQPCRNSSRCCSSCPSFPSKVALAVLRAAAPWGGCLRTAAVAAVNS